MLGQDSVGAFSGTDSKDMAARSYPVVEGMVVGQETAAQLGVVDGLAGQGSLADLSPP